MTYSTTTWIDGSTPALDAANLNKMETGIDEVHALLGEGIGLSGSFVLNNNVALRSKDSGGTARSILLMGTDNLIRIGSQVAPSSGGDLLFYANGAEAARFVPAGNLQFVDAKDVVVGTSTGTKIATSTSQKLGFFNATPVVQPSSTTDLRTALINLGLYASGGATPLNLNGGDFQTTGKVGVGGAPTHKLDIGHSGVATKSINTQHILANGSSLATVHRPYYFTFLLQATDLAASTVVSTGINSQVVFGQDGAASKGTVHGFTADYVVSGNADALNEHAAYMGALRSDIGTGMTQASGPSGRYWFTDFNVHGSIAVQPNLLSGINMYVNNYYNGSPTNGSSGVVIVTKAGAGGGGSGAHAAAPTYPIDIGLAVVGHANDTLSASGSRQGFTTAIQVGGTGGGWYPSGNTSRIGTGVHIRDYETAGITIDNRYSGATGPAMSVAAGNGPVLIGGTSALYSSTVAEVQTSTLRDPLFALGGFSAGAFSIWFRNASYTAAIVMAGGADNFFIGTEDGDVGFQARDSGKKIHLAGSASVVAVRADNTLGFFNVTPVAKAGATTDLKQALINYGLYTSGGATPLNLNFGIISDAGKVGIGLTPNAKLDIEYTSNSTGGIHAKNTYLTGAGNQVFAAYMFDSDFTATDMAGSGGFGYITTLLRTHYGDATNASTGNATTLSLDHRVINAGSQLNENCICYGTLAYDTDSSTPGTVWFTDWNMHTAIGRQHRSVQGLSLFVNNHYNGSPIGNTFAGICLSTKQGSGGGGSPAHSAAATYPIDVGFIACGHSGPSGSRQGFTTAFRAGGNAVWHDSGASRIGTGFHARDYETYGVLIDNRYSGSTAPAIAIASGQGPILSGGTTAIWANSRLEVQGPSGAADGLIVMGRDSVTNDYSMVLQTAAAFGRLFIAGGTNSFLTGTAEADIGLSHAGGAGKKIHIGGTASVIAVGADNKLGFFQTTPIVRPTGWGAPTGTATRTTFATTTVTTELLAQRVKALIDDLTSYGLIGA